MPITYRAAGPGVVILGTQDLSQPSEWAPTSTTAWSRHFVPASPPSQVFLDGLALTRAASPDTTAPDSFFYDPVGGVLFVDIGGDNPALAHSVEAGSQTYGFNLQNRSGIVVDGFEVRWQNHSGVRVSASTGTKLSGLSISSTGLYGILAEQCGGENAIE